MWALDEIHERVQLRLGVGGSRMPLDSAGDDIAGGGEAVDAERSYLQHVDKLCGGRGGMHDPAFVAASVTRQVSEDRSDWEQ
ncbi:hypothetical protein APY04_0353 [Hyphomicrobium sulfonivorans]|uniref:Uncharacterized protein n=1 Tax=Hyphomicrobium sulfonivorans TaxID=121290 RepID=A0A120CY69_HYPSL|nr:hypothetical protein APY04_0353 [Hyphomicrobium sulfonivorans]